MAETKTNERRKDRNVEELERECPSCGKRSLVRDYQRNIEICQKCGCITKEGIKDRGPEWRAFDQKEGEERRGGAPMTYTIHDKGLSTKIDWKNRDGRGKNLSPEKRAQMHRLRKWQRRARVSDSKERNLTYALSELDRMSSQLGLPKDVQEVAAVIYREAVEKSLIRGRSMEGISSAALYAGCRKAEMPRTLEEVAEVSRVDKREIRRSYMFISRELDIHLPPTDSASYVSRFGSELKLSGEARTEAIELIKEAQENNLTSGKSPPATAAAALYIASLKSGERRTQGEVAEVANVSVVTVRNRYRELSEGLDVDPT